MRTLQEWLGHRDIKTTMVYADYQASEQERELVERAFGFDSNDPAAVPEKAEHR
jgi:site-specific recombinase XerD